MLWNPAFYIEDPATGYATVDEMQEGCEVDKITFQLWCREAGALGQVQRT